MNKRYPTFELSTCLKHADGYKGEIGIIDLASLCGAKLAAFVTLKKSPHGGKVE